MARTKKQKKEKSRYGIEPRPGAKEKTAVDRVLESEVTLPNINELYREFLGKTHIEKNKEEVFVTKSLFDGRSKNWIVKNLKEKYPDIAFSLIDLDKYMVRNREVVKYLENSNLLSAKRHLAAREQVSETLASLALFTQKLVVDLRNEKDNTNSIAAIRALNSTLANYMNLEGFVSKGDEGPTTNVVVQLSDNKQRLATAVHNADFKIIDVNEDGKV